MANDQSLWNQLEHSLQTDIPITDQLLALLQQERQLLESRQYDQFQQLINQKQQLLQQLDQHATQRQQLLHSAGFDNEQHTLETLAQQAPVAASAWHKLSDQWQQCQDLNEVNERIAKRTRLVVGQILDLLRGQNNQTRLYTKKGDASNGGSGRTITSA